MLFVRPLSRLQADQGAVRLGHGPTGPEAEIAGTADCIARFSDALEDIPYDGFEVLVDLSTSRGRVSIDPLPDWQEPASRTGNYPCDRGVVRHGVRVLDRSDWCGLSLRNRTGAGAAGCVHAIGVRPLDAQNLRIDPARFYTRRQLRDLIGAACPVPPDETFAFVDAVREWLYETVLLCQDDHLLDRVNGQPYSSLAPEPLLTVLLNQLAGGWCGAHAAAMTALLSCLGLDAFTYNGGSPTRSMTHCITVVAIQEAGRRVWSAHDCYLNTWLAVGDRPADFFDYLAGSKTAVDGGICWREAAAIRGKPRVDPLRWLHAADPRPDWTILHVGLDRFHSRYPGSPALMFRRRDYVDAFTAEFGCDRLDRMLSRPLSIDSPSKHLVPALWRRICAVTGTERADADDDRIGPERHPQTTMPA